MEEWHEAGNAVSFVNKTVRRAEETVLERAGNSSCGSQKYR